MLPLTTVADPSTETPSALCTGASASGRRRGVSRVLSVPAVDAVARRLGARRPPAKVALSKELERLPTLCMASTLRAKGDRGSCPACCGVCCALAFGVLCAGEGPTAVDRETLLASSSSSTARTASAGLLLVPLPVKPPGPSPDADRTEEAGGSGAPAAAGSGSSLSMWCPAYRMVTSARARAVAGGGTKRLAPAAPSTLRRRMNTSPVGYKGPRCMGHCRDRVRWQAPGTFCLGVDAHLCICWSYELCKGLKQGTAVHGVVSLAACQHPDLLDMTTMPPTAASPTSRVASANAPAGGLEGRRQVLIGGLMYSTRYTPHPACLVP